MYTLSIYTHTHTHKHTRTQNVKSNEIPSVLTQIYYLQLWNPIEKKNMKKSISSDLSLEVVGLNTSGIVTGDSWPKYVWNCHWR